MYIHLLVQPAAMIEMLHCHLSDSTGSIDVVLLKCGKYL